MLQVFVLYIAIALTVSLFSALYVIWDRGIEYTEHGRRQVLVAIAWPLFALAGIAYFLAMGCIYVSEGSLPAAQARLEGEKTDIELKGKDEKDRPHLQKM